MVLKEKQKLPVCELSGEHEDVTETEMSVHKQHTHKVVGQNVFLYGLLSYVYLKMPFHMWYMQRDVHQNVLYDVFQVFL